MAISIILLVCLWTHGYGGRCVNHHEFYPSVYVIIIKVRVCVYIYV